MLIRMLLGLDSCIFYSWPSQQLEWVCFAHPIQQVAPSCLPSLDGSQSRLIIATLASIDDNDDGVMMMLSARRSRVRWALHRNVPTVDDKWPG